MKKIRIKASTKITTYMSKFRQLKSLLIASILLVFASTSFAGPITSLHVFGDSLSDSGALQFISPINCPPPPYAGCRFSNGPVWAELVADELGLEANTAYGGGTNWAIGGQRTDQVLNGQVATYLALSGGVADSGGLYVIWAGANDNFQNNPDGTYDPVDSANNILNSIMNLSAAGAVNFLVPNLPLADPFSNVFNMNLYEGISNMAAGLNIMQFDALSLFTDVTLNPGDYGFTNSVTPCFDGINVCDNPDEYSLWDAVHPTAAGHRIIAAAVLDIVNASSPGTLLILLMGSFALVHLRRKSQ